MTFWYQCPIHGVIIDDATDYGYNEGQPDGQYRHEISCGAIVKELTAEEARHLMDLQEQRDRRAYRAKWGSHA